VLSEELNNLKCWYLQAKSRAGLRPALDEVQLFAPDIFGKCQLLSDVCQGYRSLTTLAQEELFIRLDDPDLLYTLLSFISEASHLIATGQKRATVYFETALTAYFLIGHRIDSRDCSSCFRDLLKSARSRNLPVRELTLRFLESVEGLGGTHGADVRHYLQLWNTR
jgi:hypothetical protein